MAATVIPGQPRRWGNESTNFYYTSQSSAPGVASRQKEYRCSDSQYTNSGHYHNGTKALNLNPPLDQYGTPSAYKLRTVDQLVPKALTIDMGPPMPPDPTVNLYQSHHQNYHSYSMPPVSAQRSPTEVVGGDQAVARALNRAFYTTSYQSHIDKYANQRSRPNSANSRVVAAPIDLHSTPSLCDNLDTRRRSARPPRVKSAPPLRQTYFPTPPTTNKPHQPIMPRRRSFTMSSSYPSKGEMLKGIFLVFPSPQPQGVSKRASRPSSAVSLRTGKIPHLRN